MSWIASKIMNWASRKQEEELLDFIKKVSAADSSELGLPVASATTYRHLMRRHTGIELLNPSLALVSEPAICIRLTREIKAFQRERQFVAAAPIIIWLHSLRAVQDLKLRPHGRELWRQLSRGFPHVLDAAFDHEQRTGKLLDIRGFDQIPDGLGPQT